jgi:hypothetical protein
MFSPIDIEVGRIQGRGSEVVQIPVNENEADLNPVEDVEVDQILEGGANPVPDPRTEQLS